jgi:hypothetical protein
LASSTRTSGDGTARDRTHGALLTNTRGLAACAAAEALPSAEWDRSPPLPGAAEGRRSASAFSATAPALN